MIATCICQDALGTPLALVTTTAQVSQRDFPGLQVGDSPKAQLENMRKRRKHLGRVIICLTKQSSLRFTQVLYPRASHDQQRRGRRMLKHQALDTILRRCWRGRACANSIRTCSILGVRVNDSATARKVNVLGPAITLPGNVWCSSRIGVHPAASRQQALLPEGQGLESIAPQPQTVKLQGPWEQLRCLAALGVLHSAAWKASVASRRMVRAWQPQVLGHTKRKQISRLQSLPVPAMADDDNGKLSNHRAQFSGQPPPEMRHCSRAHEKDSGGRHLARTTLYTSRTRRRLCACLQRARVFYQVALAPQVLLPSRRRQLRGLGHITLTLLLSLVASGQAHSIELLSKGCLRLVDLEAWDLRARRNASSKMHERQRRRVLELMPLSRNGQKRTTMSHLATFSVASSVFGVTS
mmetsp:Transcript_112732/g.291330  ORF Transcript_112732/g.291330 Transcript_112732/m.291330 type:complete len:410 (-) Transcript_112732:52-1281(-)